MLFLDFARVITNLADIPEAATIALANLFEQADFGEAGLLIALCGSKPAWQIHPWLADDTTAELLIPSRLPEPYTLARVFVEMQRIIKAKTSTAPIRKQMLLTSLDPMSAAVAKQLLNKTGFVESDVLEAALATTKLRVGVPALPEKLVRYTSEEIEQVWQKLRAGYGHVKDDGYYCQLHKSGQQIIIFVGANLLEQTGRYPEIVAAVQNQVNVEEIILEGELVGLDAHERVLPRRHMNRAARYQVRIFDLLVVNGSNWCEQPYKLRREKRLSLVTGQLSGGLCHAQEFVIDSRATLTTWFERCKSEKWEGLVVKQADVRYRSGTRNPACIKLKLVEPVDATIVGYFLTPAGRVETFLLALYNEEAHQFEVCGRTRAGLSAEDIQTVLALIETETGQDPALPVVTNEMPDVWVKPRFIFEFLADYRYLSNQYLCAKMQTGQGWGLHSPVFRSAEPRPDKEGHHTTTIEQFLKLRIEAGEMPEEPSTQTGVSEQVTGQQLGFTWDAPVEDSGK